MQVEGRSPRALRFVPGAYEVGEPRLPVSRGAAAGLLSQGTNLVPGFLGWGQAPELQAAAGRSV